MGPMNNKYAKCFNRHDVGCQADGAFGHDHVRAVLRSLVNMTARDRRPRHVTETELDDLDTALAAEMSDDAWEEDAALDLLNDACDGVHFEFVDGDLMVVVDE